MYDLMYLLTNIFATYTIYKFMGVFFDKRKSSKIIEILTYIGYFITITVVYFYIKTPIVMIGTNLVIFFLLTLNYYATVRQRFGATVLIYLTLICIENVVVLFSRWSKTPLNVATDYSSIIGIIAIRILSFAAVLVISSCKNIKVGKSVSLMYWLCIIFIPSSLLVILIIIFNLPEVSRTHTLLATAIVLAINIVVFYLYDAISENANNRLRELLLEQKNRYYSKQFELMKTSLSSMSTLKHDLKNHLQAIYTLVSNSNNELALEHISKIMEICDTSRKYANSGNISVDSILNFKLHEADQNRITVTLDLAIPAQMNIPSFDMAIILGNLLDNAIRANQMVEADRYVNLTVKYDKGRLFVNIDNPYKGKLIEENGNYSTTKIDVGQHGIGLESVKTALQKYDGMIEISQENNVFTARVLMYID